MKLNVCGLREPQHIEQISRPGHRLYRLSAGVFVNEDTYSVFSAVARYDLDLVQLQGNESDAACRELKPYVKIVKSFDLTEDFNFKILESSLPHVDYFLFDRRSESGSSLDYEALQHYPYEIPFFLAGISAGYLFRPSKNSGADNFSPLI